MAGEEVTTNLNVDITQFKTALTEANRYIRMANSEFENATAGAEKWTSTTDGLRAKITQLNKTLDAQEIAAAALRQEYNRVAAEQGENSAGAQELAIKLNKQEAACKKTAAQIQKYKGDLNDMEAAADDAGDESEKMGAEVEAAADATKKAAENAKDAEKETSGMSAAFEKAATAAGTLAKGLASVAGKTIVTGIKSLAAASGALVTAFLATGEASKEHITEMAKLDAAYKSAGHSAETAAKTYGELYSVIGETDQAVEASQQIALLAKSEQDAAKWAELGAGVIGKFGDALQPETFFEAANETFSLNEATGAYVQMIEQCGLSVDKFNKGLAKCKTEEQKQAYMLEYTEKALGAAAEAYREANAAVIENNKANAALQDSLSGVGEAALPVMSTLKLMGAALLNELMPNIKTFGTSFKEALGGSKTAAADMGNAVGSMLQTLIQKFMDALPSIITVGTSIITSLLQGLTKSAPALASGVTQLVQYIVQAAPQLLQAGAALVSALVSSFRQNLPEILKTGGEMLAQLLDGIVSGLPAMAQGALNAIGSFVSGIQTNLPVVLSKGSELLGKLGEGIRQGLPNFVSQALDIVMNFATTLYNSAPKLIETGFNLLSDLVAGVISAIPELIAKGPEIISEFANVINDNFPTVLKKGAELLWQIIKGLVSVIPDLLKNADKILMAIVDVFEAFNWLNLGKSIFTALKNGMASMLSAIKSTGQNVFDAVVNAIKALPSKLLELGKNALSSLKDAILGGQSGVETAAKNIFTAIVDAIKSLPSKLLELGADAVAKMASALSPSTVKSKAIEIFNGIVNTFNGLPGKMTEIGKEAINGIISGIGAMVGKLYDSIKNALSGLVKKAKAALDINSPSGTFRDVIGKMIPAGIADGIVKNTKAAISAMVKSTRSILSAANAELSGSTIGGPNVGTPAATGGTRGQGGKTFVFNQYNTSPKALSRKEIYRQTNNALKFATAK